MRTGLLPCGEISWETSAISPSGSCCFLLILALFNLFSGGQTSMASNSRSYSDFVAAVDAGTVAQVTLDGEEIRYRGTDGRDYVTIMPADASVTDMLIARDIPVQARSQEQSGLTAFILSLLPFLLLIGSGSIS